MMKKIIFLTTFIFFVLSSCTDKYDVDTGNIESILEDESQRDQMLFTRLMAVAMKSNNELRKKVNDLSKHKQNLYFNEVLIKDLLPLDLGGETVNELLENIVVEEGDDLEISDYNSFITGLLDDLPLLVIKIPDWLIDTKWNTDNMKPRVFSNLYGADSKIYGFENDGSFYTKPKYFKSSQFELLVKNSEDYFLIKNKNIFESLQHPCMSIDEFVQHHCRIWDGDILVKKRDLQKLFGACAPEYNANYRTVSTDCPRNEGVESNYITGFQLAVPEIIHTLHNDNCIAGEETFDFQVDFHYGIRTGEEELDLSHYLMIPLFGIRYAELINPDGTTRLCDIFIDFPKKALDFTYFIDKEEKDWNRDKYGNNIIVIWNEIDILNCFDKKYFNKEPILYSHNSALGFLGKDKVPDALYNTSMIGPYNKEGLIFGQNIIPAGWNNYAYCEEIKINSPTGPQALYVIFEMTFNE